MQGVCGKYIQIHVIGTFPVLCPNAKPVIKVVSKQKQKMILRLRPKEKVRHCEAVECTKISQLLHRRGNPLSMLELILSSHDCPAGLLRAWRKIVVAYLAYCPRNDGR